MSQALMQQFLSVCKSGDVQTFNQIFSSLSLDDKNKLIQCDRYACFHIAAAEGNVDIIHCIFKFIKSVTNETPPDEAMIPVFLAREGEGFKAALRHQHFKTIEIILEEEYLFRFCIDIISENPDFIKSIFNSSLRNCVLYLFGQSCSDNIASVERILKIIPKDSHHLLFENVYNKLYITNTFYFLLLHPFEKACQSGQIEIAQLLWNLFTDDYKKKMINEKFKSSFVFAAKNGHLEIIKLLMTWVKIQEVQHAILVSEAFSGFIYAADKGYLSVVQFIWQSLPSFLQKEALKASNFAAYRWATKNQHFNVVKFFEEYTENKMRQQMKKKSIKALKFKN